MAMRGITIKLTDETLKRLEQEARATGRSVAAIIRDRIAAQPGSTESVYALTHDLAGSLAGSHEAATNARRKFRHS